MKRAWLAALLLNLAFFGAWAALEEWRHRDAAEFLLATEGADPRDLWSGQYLALAFPDARLDSQPRLQRPADGTPMAVRLEAVGDTLVGGQRWPLWRSVKFEPVIRGDFSAYPASQGWARGEAQGGRVRLGIERFYFPEDEEAKYRKLVPGRYFARVALSPDGRLRIRQLVW
jgi:uncharacterized membrane-anchored protein